MTDLDEDDNLNIYLVMADTGEFSWHRIWQVTSYTEESMALLHVQKANDWCKEKGLYQPDENEVGYLDSIEDSSSYPEETGKNPYDPKMEVSHNGTRYWVVDLSLFDHLDQFLGLE